MSVLYNNVYSVSLKSLNFVADMFSLKGVVLHSVSRYFYS